MASATFTLSSEPAMHHYDVWIDLECAIDGVRQVVGTVFGKLDFPIRPMVGERVTFWSAQGALTRFDLITVSGSQSHHYIDAEIDDIAHHFHPSAGDVIANVYLRCAPVVATTVADARRILEFLVEQHGFELDPYGPSSLG